MGGVLVVFYSFLVPVVAPSYSFCVDALPHGFAVIYRHGVPLRDLDVGAPAPLTDVVVQGGADCDAGTVGAASLKLFIELPLLVYYFQTAYLSEHHSAGRIPPLSLVQCTYPSVPGR